MQKYTLAGNKTQSKNLKKPRLNRRKKWPGQDIALQFSLQTFSDYSARGAVTTDLAGNT
jgi:hypothetical protein